MTACAYLGTVTASPNPMKGLVGHVGRKTIGDALVLGIAHSGRETSTGPDAGALFIRFLEGTIFVIYNIREVAI